MKLCRLSALAAASVAFSGCGEENFGLPVGDVSGLWTSTVYEYQDAANPGSTIDLVARDGALLTMTIDNSGIPPLVSATFNDGLGGGWSAGGTVDVAAGELTLGTDTFSIDHDGNTMTLTNTVMMFDFGNGSVTATLRITLGRL